MESAPPCGKPRGMPRRDPAAQVPPPLVQDYGGLKCTNASNREWVRVTEISYDVQLSHFKFLDPKEVLGWVWRGFYSEIRVT